MKQADSPYMERLCTELAAIREKTPLRKNKPDPVTDPLKDAKERFGGAFRETEFVFPFGQSAAFHTTGEFEKLEKGFVRHCGPTAIVNILCTIDALNPVKAGARLNAKQAFRRVAGIGKDRHYYFNADILGIYGGTFNILKRFYLNEALRTYHINGFETGHSRRAGKTALENALKSGSMLYLQLWLHPLYGNHHLTAYGYKKLIRSNETKDGGGAEVSGSKDTEKLYILVADGWSHDTRYICADDLKFGAFMEIKAICSFPEGAAAAV